MSDMFYDLFPNAVFFKTYGFQSVTRKQMQSIIHRLQRQTFCREFAHSECFKSIPSPPRTPAVTCKRACATRPESHDQFLRPRPFSASAEETSRIFKRVRKPTISYRASVGQIPPSYTQNIRQNANIQTPKQQKKSTLRLLKPTTAVKYRTGEGSRNDPDIVKYSEYDFSDDKVAPAKKVEKIVERIRTPTIASTGGVGPRCPRRKDSIECSKTPRKPPPLISGLPRSKSIHEIVERLSTRHHTSSVHSCYSPRLKTYPKKVRRIEIVECKDDDVLHDSECRESTELAAKSNTYVSDQLHIHETKDPLIEEETNNDATDEFIDDAPNYVTNEVTADEVTTAVTDDSRERGDVRELLQAVNPGAKQEQQPWLNNPGLVHQSPISLVEKTEFQGGDETSTASAGSDWPTPESPESPGAPGSYATSLESPRSYATSIMSSESFATSMSPGSYVTSIMPPEYNCSYSPQSPTTEEDLNDTENLA